MKRIIVIDDSLMYQQLLSSKLEETGDIQVIGKASSVEEGIELFKRLMPDAVTLDIEMPKTNGLEFLRKISATSKVPVIIVSSSMTKISIALDEGAVDYVRKPSSSKELPHFINQIADKIKLFTGDHKTLTNSVKQKSVISGNRHSQVVAIGASTGGTVALEVLLKQLPKEMPPVLITQHMPEGFTRLFADRLDDICEINVCEAVDGEEIFAGCAYIAPGKYHMKVVQKAGRYFIQLEKQTESNKVNGHCPSVDVMFDSIQSVYGKKATGVILTGMGKDGAKGLLGMRNSGSWTIGQDEATSAIYGMPKVAFDIGAVCEQSPIGEIAGRVLRALAKGGNADA